MALFYQSTILFITVFFLTAMVKLIIKDDAQDFFDRIEPILFYTLCLSVALLFINIAVSTIFLIANIKMNDVIKHFIVFSFSFGIGNILGYFAVDKFIYK